jgi:hypothetical protein
VTDRARRRELRAQSLAAPPRAGVYIIRNSATGRILLGSTTNLESVRNKLEFGRSTGLAGVLDHRLRRDADEDGIDAFTFEVVEALDVTPDMTPAGLRAELDTLEALCREGLGDVPRY